MKPRVIVSVTCAQLRILQRLRRGECLPTHRYRREHATMAAIERKGLALSKLALPKLNDRIATPALKLSRWELTELGARVSAAPNGVLREGDPVRPPAPVIIDRTPRPAAPPRHQHEARVRGRARRAS